MHKTQQVGRKQFAWNFHVPICAAVFLAKFLKLPRRQLFCIQAIEYKQFCGGVQWRNWKLKTGFDYLNWSCWTSCTSNIDVIVKFIILEGFDNSFIIISEVEFPCRGRQLEWNTAGDSTNLTGQELFLTIDQWITLFLNQPPYGEGLEYWSILNIQVYQRLPQRKYN